jgi:hypothetical protein
MNARHDRAFFNQFWPRVSLSSFLETVSDSERVLCTTPGHLICVRVEPYLRSQAAALFFSSATFLLLKKGGREKH